MGLELVSQRNQFKHPPAILASRVRVSLFSPPKPGPACSANIKTLAASPFAQHDHPTRGSLLHCYDRRILRYSYVARIGTMHTCKIRSGSEHSRGPRTWFIWPTAARDETEARNHIHRWL